MKKSYLTILCWLLYASLSAQILQEVVTVSAPTEHYIKVKAALAKNSERLIIPVSLPENTISWYYAFAAYRTPDQIARAKAKFELLGNLTKAVDRTGLVNKGIQIAGSPPGSDYCDADVLSRNHNGNLYAVEAYRKPNLKEGTVLVSHPDYCSGTQYLSFTNGSTAHGVSVIVEVVAIVEKEQAVNEWTSNDRQLLYNDLFTIFLENNSDQKYSLEQIRGSTRCASSKVVSEWPRNRYNTLADFEREAVISDISSTCLPIAQYTSRNTNNPVKFSPENLPGKWEDNNSIFTLYPNGISSIFWDNGTDALGTWKLRDNYLTLDFGFVTRYKVLYFDNQEFVFKDISTDDAEIYFANRLEQKEDLFLPADFIGTWKDENSTFRMNGDGTISIAFNTGGTMNGKWEVNGRLLSVTFNQGHIDYDIIEFSPDRFIYQHRDGNREVYLARKN